MAADDTLVCNFKKCRKRLKNFAWATSCSHVFCDEDGNREFNKTCVCPACETELPGKYDIVRVDLQPSEEYKSMVLAGQRPETVIEITSRALSFWTYQSHQERMYQEFCATKAKERLQQLESYYDQLLTRTQAELSSVKSQIDSLRKELDSTKLKYNEASEKLMEKSRQYQKLQGLYDTLRRRNVTMATFEDSENHPQLSPRRYLSHPHPKPDFPVSKTGQTDLNHPPYQQGRTQNSGVSVTTMSTLAHTNIQQVDPALAAAVNVGALHQSQLTKHIPTTDQFMLELGTNPISHKIGKRV